MWHQGSFGVVLFIYPVRTDPESAVQCFVHQETTNTLQLATCNIATLATIAINLIPQIVMCKNIKRYTHEQLSLVFRSSRKCSAVSYLFNGNTGAFSRMIIIIAMQGAVKRFIGKLTCMHRWYMVHDRPSHALYSYRRSIFSRSL